MAGTAPRAAFDDLREQLTGRLVLPDDGDYDEERSVFNSMIDARPAALAACATVEDVQRAVRFAREHDLEIAVRAGGHSVAGMSLTDAYRSALAFTGRIVALVGFTLAAGVLTWAWSPIKFQADMGILLAFMFLWNMLGALILIPALSRFLLPTSALIKQPARQSQPFAEDIAAA